jgi:hypothetical protein
MPHFTPKRFFYKDAATLAHPLRITPAFLEAVADVSTQRRLFAGKLFTTQASARHDEL